MVPSTEIDWVSVVALPKTLSEALERDLSQDPLSKEEHEQVMDNLNICLLMLGCDVSQLNEGSNDILKKIQPIKFYFDEAFDRLDERRRSTAHREGGEDAGKHRGR